jgi:hypothetical protein
MIEAQNSAEASARAPRDIPVIMSRTMVRALLAGKKTQTRRLAWRPKEIPKNPNVIGSTTRRFQKPSAWQRLRTGDLLWVRESWRPDDYAPDDVARTIFMADAPTDMLYETRGIVRWRPSIHLPRDRSRLTLIVEAIKTEPLLMISEEDARAEGFEDSQLGEGFGPRDFGGGCTIESSGTFASAAGMFQITWARLHPEWDGYSSPDVVAVAFRVIRANIDSPEVSPDNARLARARREAALMGKEEGARHIIRSLGKVVTTFEPGSLFAGLEVGLPAAANDTPPIPEPAESNDPGQIATEGPEQERPPMEAKQPGEQDVGEMITAGARAVSSPALRTPVDPDAVEGASEDARTHHRRFFPTVILTNWSGAARYSRFKQVGASAARRRVTWWALVWFTSRRRALS